VFVTPEARDKAKEAVLDRLTFKFLDACRPCELVRFTGEQGTQWALAGAHGNAMLMLLIFPLGGPPFCENIMGDLNTLLRPYEQTLVLSYGTNYSIRPDHAAACEIGDGGNLVRDPGSYVITAKDEFICCRYDRAPTKIGYFDLKTGRVMGEPGGERAVFGRWEMDLKSKEKDEPPIPVFQVHANKGLSNWQ
jgi:hypothetical protein